MVTRLNDKIKADSDKPAFGDRVKEKRIEMDMTQEDLAKKLGVSRPTVAQWERNANPTDLPTISAVAKHLNTTAEYLAFGVRNEKIVYRTPEEDNMSIIKELAFSGPDESTTLKKWAMPTDWIKDKLRTNPEGLCVIESPTTVDKISEGDKVLCDTNDRRPSPEGLFAHWDGYGVIINQMMIIPNIGVRVFSPNSDRSYDAQLDDIKLIGRIKGKWGSTS
ncbi:MAG: helix-turn-helix transcriptional regulator [Robiginitomaculum sp.]|nr:helix-turn-helix transcriptional regulator [Robiginitomaculum sp.]